MLSSQSLPLVILLSVLLALPLSSAAPAAHRRETSHPHRRGISYAHRRDASYDAVRDAVVALPAAFPRQGSAPGSGSNLAVDGASVSGDAHAIMLATPEYSSETLYTPTSSASPTDGLPDAQVLAAEGQGDEGGYWQIFTTSRWITDGAATPTGPIDAFISDPAISASASGGDAGGVSSQSVPGAPAAPLAPSAPPAPSAPSTPPAPDAPPAPGSSSGFASALPPATSSGSPPTSSTGTSSGSAPSGTSSSSPILPPSDGSYLPGKHVFAHFMIGIVSSYTTSDWVADITLAKAKGISGFALNIGVDPYSQDQLDLAYDAAAQVGGFNMFISFDFNWYSIGDTAGVATMMKRYVDKPAQFMVDGKPFVSSFIGDGFNWGAAAQIVGREIYAVPFFQPNGANAGDAGISGLFSWAAWMGQEGNIPVKANMTMGRDEEYLSVLNPVGKKYMAPVSPWFFTHFGPEVPYSKNWLFYSESLWHDRWEQILELGQQGVDFVEIITWNDYGEAHHIGPYGSAHTDDGASKWAEGLDHTAMLDFAVPYIAAFRQGKAEPVIAQESLTYWYRPTTKAATCDASDNCGSKPEGWDMVDDTVFVAASSTQGGTVTVKSGDQAVFTQDVGPGVQMVRVPMGVGAQSFEFSTKAGLQASGKSDVDISDSCWKGIYNYNFHSGTVA